MVGAVPRVLTIDDDSLVRQSIVMYLEDCGYDVLEAENGKVGLELFFAETPDLVLCDLRMPEVDGMDVLNQITQHSSKTPVIMISGAGMINDVVEALRLGADDYLVKPITDLEVLKHAVTQALTKKELEKQNLMYKTELQKANQELQANLTVLQEDQDAGRRAQLQLLPPVEFSFENYSFSHKVIPSLNVSGDFLDFFEIDQRYIGFYLADVSGHGSASAFVTMMLKSLFNQPIRNYRINGDKTILSPSLTAAYLNEEIIDANLGKHVTLFYAVLDTHDKKLSYCIAGQFPRPIIYQHNQLTKLPQRGFPVGLFSWATFEQSSIDVAEEFSLFMFSDGVLECMKADTVVQENFLEDLELNHGASVDDIASQLEVNSFDRLPDDISIFILRNR
jgi:serine phosphatase RsbU (regulator of sigma subunit)